MNRFHLITNETKDPDGSYTGRLAELLRKNGAQSVTSGPNPPADAEAVLVLGGDGTMLKASGDLLGRATPLLGINIGNLGYLAESDFDSIEPDIVRLIKGDYVVEDRMMLWGVINTSGVDSEDHCLNDIVITGYGALCLIKYEVIVNGSFLNGYSADGLIVSTPTGSTGYNLSAGGPIVEPGASTIVLTPICPHTLNTRSIVLRPEDEIVVRIPDTCRSGVAIQFDGRKPQMIENGDYVTIRRSEKVTRLIKLGKNSFLSTLHQKLKPM